jgi:hypothetical protein
MLELAGSLVEELGLKAFNAALLRRVRFDWRFAIHASQYRHI